MKHVDVVVIGCGVAGAWTALMLAEARAGRVVVLDKAHPGAGASTKGQGMIRVHHANRFEIDLAFQSRRYYREWPDTVGMGSCGWRETGMMWIVAPENVARLRENAEIQRQIGCAALVLEPSEIVARWPSLSPAGIGAGVYEPEGGTAVGAHAIDGLVSRLIVEGVEVRSHTAVTRILHDGERVRGVETADESIAADRVVIAAGAWSAAIARTAGIELPIAATRATLGTAYYPPEIEPVVAVFDEIYDCSFSPKSGGSWATVSVRDDGFLTSVDPDDLQEPDVDAALVGIDLIARRIPAMRDAVLGARWAAADGVTPDGRPIIGEHPELSGLYIHAAGNFKGFKMAPIGARGLVAQMIGRQDPDLDIEPYRPGRFASDGDIAPWQAAPYAHSRWT